ncbi:hypothetical protein [Mycolicibacterium sphagni]|uniref:hypothetical protein n=1 Tax=Mycolicibacterium sphagni TaxID=1786 RepID=UPI001055DF93|nr:hypothetical protein [Mycolicibacterium sphagni]
MLILIGCALSAILVAVAIFRRDATHVHTISIALMAVISRHGLVFAMIVLIAIAAFIVITIRLDVTKIRSRMIPPDSMRLDLGSLNVSSRGSHQSFPDLIDELNLIADLRFPGGSGATARLSLEHPADISPRGRLRVSVDSSCATFDAVRRIDHFGPPDEELIVCVARYRKDRILQDFQVLLNGSKWTTLHSEEGKALTLQILESQYAGLSTSEQANRVFVTALEMVLSDHSQWPEEPVRFRTTKIPMYPHDVLSELRRLLNALDNSKSDVHRFMRMLEDMCSYRPIWISLGLKHSPIWTVAGDSTWARVECKYSLPVPTSRTIAEKIRTGLFGLAARELVLPMYGALESRSWHFSYLLPEGCYVYAAGIVPHPSEHRRWFSKKGRARASLASEGKSQIDFESSSSRLDGPSSRREALKDVAISWFGDSQPHARLSGVGSNRLNVYLRDYAKIAISPKPRDANSKPPAPSVLIPTIPTLYVDARERPPGILLPTVVVASYSLIISTLLSFWPPSFASGVSDRWWTVTVFGLPPVISAWVLSQLRRSTFDRASLVVMVCACWGIVNPLLLLIACFVNVARSKPFELHGGIPGIVPRLVESSDLLLSFATLSSLSNVILCVALLTARAARFIGALRWESERRRTSEL